MTAIALVRESLTRIRELHDKFAFVHALVPLAAAAALKGDDAWAARILGARDAVTERTGATVVDKSVHDLREQAEREARARLGPDRWAQAYAAGRRTSIDALLKDIDDAPVRLRAAELWHLISPRAHPVPVGVVKEHIDITRHMAEHPQQQRDLPTVMNTMIGRVLHQLA